MTTDTFTGLAEGDRVLFNDRKQPLTVESVEEERVRVAGPHGGEYVLFRAEDSDAVLVASPGNRRYASYVKDLRVVGEWAERGDGRWVHTDTGAEISLEKTGAGFWTLQVSGLDADVPKYGFTTREVAVEEAETLMRDSPEGGAAARDRA